MNAEETGRLLAECASYDRRSIGDVDVIAWLRVLGDLPLADCLAAAACHYADSTDWIMPAHIRRRVKAMRADRLAREPVPAPPPELADQPARYKAELAAGVARIADGHQIHLAIADPVREDPPPQEFTEARATLGPALPRNRQELAQRQAAESRAERETRDTIGQPPGETA